MNANWFWNRLAQLRSRPVAQKTSHTQPLPEVNGKDVERIVERDFPYEFTTVMTLLEECGTDAFRVQLACLKLACGNLEKLRTLINSAKLNYRDVLAHAEYPEYFRTGLRTNMPEDARQRVYERDWEQYEAWLRR